MASKKVGTLIKEARTGAGLTQEQLKRIAKATGVTQASLLNATKNTKSSSSSSSRKSTASKSSMQVTAAEKKLVELYRKADSKTKKEVLQVLKGEDSITGDLLESLMDNVDTEKILDSILDSVLKK